MISLLVDEAYAIDYLSILDVKYNKTKDIESYKLAGRIAKFLEAQLGYDKVKEIYNSEEWKTLKELNSKIFDAIEDLRNGLDVTAKSIDLLNLERHVTKQQLQQKYFNNELTEKKIGKYSDI
jgi:hypothetical protein